MRSKQEKSVSFPPKKWGKWLGWVLKIGITLGALGYVGWKLWQDGAESWAVIRAMDAQAWSLMGVALLMLPLNLGFEVEKWRLMMRQYYPQISRKIAWQAVLAGFPSGLLTPNRLGEYAGRVLFLAEGKRLEATALTFVDKFCQMLITLWAGGLAIFLLNHSFPQLFPQLLHLKPVFIRLSLWLFLLINLILTPATIFAKHLIPLLPTPQKESFQRVYQAFSMSSPAIIAQILLLSLLRFLTFSSQYFLLLLAFQYVLDWSLAWVMIWAVFWVKSVVPSIALSELGVRESAAIAIMGALGVASMTAFGATFLLYAINILLPSLVGIVFVYRIS